jgi:hypothetical protein
VCFITILLQFYYNHAIPLNENSFVKEKSFEAESLQMLI